MARDYRPLERDQLFLLPPDMKSWLPQDHFVWFLLAVVDRLDMSGFERSRRLGGVGRRGFDPRMLLGLLIYAYAGGQRSSRRIEDLCGTDVAFKVICALDPPDHSTIARFRKDNTGAVESLFVQVLELAGEAGLGRVGVVALDGTRIAANASHQANRRRSWLREQVGTMMAEADQVDEAEDDLFGEESDPSRVDPEWADPTTRDARIVAALARSEQAAEKATAPHRDRAAAAEDRVQHAEQKVADIWAAAEPEPSVTRPISSCRPTLRPVWALGPRAVRRCRRTSTRGPGTPRPGWPPPTTGSRRRRPRSRKPRPGRTRGRT